MKAVQPMDQAWFNSIKNPDLRSRMEALARSRNTSALGEIMKQNRMGSLVAF